MRAHWPEYASEAAGLGLFMLAACVCGAAINHPASRVAQAVPDPVIRRLLMGLAMGATAIALVYSPWGRRSGAHLNPATTLTFWRLGKIPTPDAVAYAAAQIVGAISGVLLATMLIGSTLAHPNVRYVATVPGAAGQAAAFGAEVAITFLLMTVVLNVSNHAVLARYTGLAAGALVAVYITVEAPISGMSMNPARTFASALPAGTWTAFWIYVVAPPTGMLAAAEVYARRRGLGAVHCAKLHHDAVHRCIFRCRYAELRGH
jgi:aquaporin Z